jgi:hypothetical protein
MPLHISAVQGSCHSMAISVFEPIAEMPDVFLCCMQQAGGVSVDENSMQLSGYVLQQEVRFHSRLTCCISCSFFFITGTSSSWVCGFIIFFLTLIISWYSQYIFWFVDLYCNWRLNSDHVSHDVKKHFRVVFSLHVQKMARTPGVIYCLHSCTRIRYTVLAVIENLGLVRYEILKNYSSYWMWTMS